MLPIPQLRHVLWFAAVLIATGIVAGCGSDEPVKKSETVQDKSIDESTKKSGGSATNEAGPAQRTKRGLN